jgi:hypothetical protein
MPTPSRPPPVAAAERKRGCVRRAADSSSSRGRRSLAGARQLLRMPIHIKASPRSNCRAQARLRQTRCRFKLEPRPTQPRRGSAAATNANPIKASPRSSCRAQARLRQARCRFKLESRPDAASPGLGSCYESQSTSRPPPVAAAERKRGCVRRATDSSSSRGRRSLAKARQLRGFTWCWIRRYLRRGLGSRCVDTYAPMRP